jgi:hypothetical protein
MLAAGLAGGGAAEGATILVPKQAAWRYLDDGSDPQTDWKEIWHDDDAWDLGRAELGYGDDLDGRPETTVISGGPDPNNRYITTYFRRFFFVEDVASIRSLTAHLLRDDGGIVYLNGTEVLRSHMPDGPVDFLTLASAPGVNGAEETTFFTGSINPQVLFNGINLVAVEIHQHLPSSSDLSFDFELVANEDTNPPAAAVVRGPYLQNLTPSSLVVRWRTDAPTDSRVRFGLQPNALSWTAGGATPKTEHTVTLTNLAPDTRYYYEIGGGGVFVGGPDYFFVTGPATQRPTRIWVIGDSGSASAGVPAGPTAVYQRYREFTGNRYTDLWLMLGDNAYYNGTDAEYQVAVFNLYPELLRQTALWSTIGNHETYSVEPDGLHAYLSIFTLPTAGEAGGEPSGNERYYSFNYGNIHIVCLDSEESGRAPGSPMLTWLEEDLAANTNDWTIAMWHSPPYSKGSHDSDNLFDNFGNMTDMRANIVPILERYGVDLVLCGHSHNYERSFLMDGHYGFSDSLTPSMIKDSGSGRPEDTGPYCKPDTGPGANQGTVYVVAGSSGWATIQTGYHPVMYTALLRMGSLVLDIDGHRLDARFLRETGAIDDHFTIVKGVPAEPLRIARILFENFATTVHWKSMAGRTYRVEKTESLETPDWQPASEDMLATGATTSWTGSALSTTGRCFLRVVEIR